MKICTGGGQFFADGFAIRRSFSLEEGESRLLSYVSDTGCGATTITLTQGELLTEGRIGVIRWQWGAELYPLPFVRPWEENAEREILTPNGKVIVRVRGGDSSVIAITGDVRYEHTTARPLYAPKISLIEGQRFPIVRIDALCEAGAAVLMIALGEKEGSLLLEECGESVVCEGNEVRIEKRYADLSARRVTVRYLWRGDRFACSREIVCANEHTPTREECGRALLEAAMARDERAISALLSPEIGDAEAILDYFGEILSVRPAIGSEDRFAAAAVTRGNKGLTATIYSFDFDENGRISNIRNE